MSSHCIGGFLVTSTLGDLDNDSFWNVMIEKYYPMVLRTAYILTGDRETAKDVAQEAFARAVDGFRQLKNPDKFGSWLITITINTARDSLNQEKRVVRACATDVDACISSFDLLNRNENIPLEMAERQEVRDTMREATSRLAPQERRATFLRYYLDMKEIDIAEILGVTLGTVKSLLSRARWKLHQELKDRFVEGGGTDERGQLCSLFEPMHQINN
jgi:RNA polymerase sigma-70 factor (ECF subfamily)